MKILKLIVLFVAVLSLGGYAQEQLPIKYRVDNQSMSTPMTNLEDIFFDSPYTTRPVNVQFDGSLLNMYFDNGSTYAKINVTKVRTEKEVEDGVIISERNIYVDNANASDTLLFVVDYNVGYVQMIVPTKNSKGDYYGYTSFRKFVPVNELASK
jgi:hypothetical protein